MICERRTEIENRFDKFCKIIFSSIWDRSQFLQDSFFYHFHFSKKVLTHFSLSNTIVGIDLQINIFQNSVLKVAKFNLKLLLNTPDAKRANGRWRASRELPLSS